jgi:hypothetical protein
MAPRQTIERLSSRIEALTAGHEAGRRPVMIFGRTAAAAKSAAAAHLADRPEDRDRLCVICWEGDEEQWQRET